MSSPTTPSPGPDAPPPASRAWTLPLRLVAQGALPSFLILLAATLITRLPIFFFSFFNGDEATYSALASRILDGALPYAGAVDHKPPGIELTYALVYAAFGRNRILFVRLLLILVVATTGAVVAAIAHRLDGRREARIAGLLYVIASTLGLPGDTQAANTELFANLPLSLAALATTAALGRRGLREAALLVAAGLLTGVAGLYRYQAIVAGAAWALAVLLPPAEVPLTVAGPTAGRPAGGASGPVRVRRLALLGVGFAAVLSGYLAAFRATGTWEPFRFWGWRFSFDYMVALPVAEQVRYGLLYTALVGASWAPLLLGLSRRGGRPPLVGDWLLATLVAIIPGGRFTPHYYLMALPPLCLLATPGLSAILRGGSGWRRSACLLLGLTSLTVWNGAAWLWYPLKPHLKSYQSAYLAVGDYIHSHSGPADRVFVWGNSAEIYYFSDRVMGTRFPFCNYHAGKIWGTRLDEVDAEGTEAHIVPRAWSELLADLDATPPRFIVDGGAGRLDRFDLHPIDRYPALAERLQRSYRLDAVVAGVPVYRRKD